MFGQILAAALLGGAIVVLIGALAALYKAQRRIGVLERELRGAPGRGDPRVDQLAQALEVVAGQVEQLASGQEFLHRVLAERTAPRTALPADAPRAVTPH